MQPPQQSRRWPLVGWALLALWAGAFGGAFVAFAVTPPSDFGFTAGLNRVSLFLTWQAGAGALAILCAVVRPQLPPGAAPRRLLLVPPAILLSLILALAALVLWANLSRSVPAPSTPPGQETAPAPDLPASDAVE